MATYGILSRNLFVTVLGVSGQKSVDLKGLGRKEFVSIVPGASASDIAIAIAAVVIAVVIVFIGVSGNGGVVGIDTTVVGIAFVRVAAATTTVNAGNGASEDVEVLSLGVLGDEFVCSIDSIEKMTMLFICSLRFS